MRWSGRLASEELTRLFWRERRGGSARCDVAGRFPTGGCGTAGILLKRRQTHRRCGSHSLRPVTRFCVAEEATLPGTLIMRRGWRNGQGDLKIAPEYRESRQEA